jgi:outer membrane protein TolC
MDWAGRRGWRALLLCGSLGLAWPGPATRAQEPPPSFFLPAPSDRSAAAGDQEFVAPPLRVQVAPETPPAAAPAVAPGDRPLPINLPTALQLANVRPIDVAVASQRIQAAAAELEQARVLWLPTVYLGTDYFRHDGQIQDVAGGVFGTSKSSFLLGAGPYAVFALSDAIFGPLAARQVLRARESTLQTARNDSLLAVAEAYFNVQQARGDLAGAEDVARRSEDLVRRAQDLLPGGVIPELEVVRARTQADRSRQAVRSACERWRQASADLVRVLRLDPSAVVQPLEPPQLRVTLVPTDRPVDDLIRVGLTNRPELATQQALVQATLERLRQEKLRPLIPSVLLRGASTPVTGTLAGGLFGGGENSDMSHFGARMDLDLQVLWKLDSLGFGNQALVRQRRAENQLAVLELFRTQDRVAAEVAQAYAQAQSAAGRLGDAEAELRDAVESADKNLQGLRQTGTGAALATLVRPQEVVAAVQALAQAYADYDAAVADYDRAQFRLYHALGNPAQALGGGGRDCPAPPGHGEATAPQLPPAPTAAPAEPRRPPG